jgi:hypothetical protein
MLNSNESITVKSTLRQIYPDFASPSLDRERPSAIDHGFFRENDLQKTPCLTDSANGSGTTFPGEMIDIIKAGSSGKACTIPIIPSQNSEAPNRKQLLT